MWSPDDTHLDDAEFDEHSWVIAYDEDRQEYRPQSTYDCLQAARTQAYHYATSLVGVGYMPRRTLPQPYYRRAENAELHEQPVHTVRYAVLLGAGNKYLLSKGYKMESKSSLGLWVVVILCLLAMGYYFLIISNFPGKKNLLTIFRI